MNDLTDNISKLINTSKGAYDFNVTLVGDGYVIDLIMDYKNNDDLVEFYLNMHSHYESKITELLNSFLPNTSFRINKTKLNFTLPKRKNLYTEYMVNGGCGWDEYVKEQYYIWR